jgi:rod shape-determining protein MreC
VVGTGDPSRLTVRVLDPVADVQVGDAVLSFGSKDGRPFPPDLPIGLVSEIEDDGTGGRIIRLTPAANLSALDLVGVVNLNATRDLRQQLSAEPPAQEAPPEIPVDLGGGVG